VSSYELFRVSYKGDFAMMIVSIGGTPWGGEFESFNDAFDAVLEAWKANTLPLPFGKATEVTFDCPEADEISAKCWGTAEGDLTMSEPEGDYTYAIDLRHTLCF